MRVRARAGEIGVRSTLRYAVQLLTPAKVLVQTGGREQITKARGAIPHLAAAVPIPLECDGADIEFKVARLSLPSFPLPSPDTRLSFHARPA
eukprot:4051222-Pleurochrysis_carterae.AAC.1